MLLVLLLLLTPSRVDIKYESKGPGADDVLTLLQAWWPKPFTTDKQEFIQRVTAAPTLNFSQGVGTVVGDVVGKDFGVKLYHSRAVDTPVWFKVGYTYDNSCSSCSDMG